MRFRLRNVIAVGALTSGLIAGGALVADAATTTSTSASTGSTGTSGTSGSSTTPASSSTASSATTKHCTNMGTGSGSRPAQGEAPPTAPASG
jgi:hypothetical protein